MKQNIIEATASFDVPEEYDMTVGDMQLIYKLYYEYNRCPFTLISTAFKFGFVKGQEAAEKREGR